MGKINNMYIIQKSELNVTKTTVYKYKITNKKELCMYFIHFHNKVNVRNKKKIFTFDEFVSKYNTSVTRNVIANFFIVLSKSDHNVKLMTNSFQRSASVLDLKKWLNMNASKFSP